MTDYITATVDPDLPQVQISMWRNYPSDPFELIRTDASGTRRVRVPAGLNTNRSEFTFTDYEPALGPCTYITYSGDTAEVDLAASGHRLPTFSLPFAPTIRQTVPTVMTFEGPRTAPVVVHDVIDRRLPLATLRPLGGRSGRLQAMVRTWTDCKDLEGLLEMGQVVHYREADNPGMDAYMVIRGTDPRRVGTLWTLDVDWTEVAPPTAPYDDRSWTFADVRDRLATFHRLSTEYVSFNDLTTGGTL